MRALIAVVVVLAVAALSIACSSRGPLAAPSWARSALATEDADLVLAVNVARIREDKLLAAAVAKLVHGDRGDFLLGAQQVDGVANLPNGDLGSWVGVVHGMDAPPREGEVLALGPSHRIASGALEFPHARGAMLVFPGAWVFAEGAALERMRATPPGPLGRIPMQDGAILEVTLRGRALQARGNARVARLTQGLVETTLVLFSGDRLAMIVRGRYAGATSAALAEEDSRAQLQAIASRHDFALALVRDLVEVEVTRSGDTVTWRVSATARLREYVREYAEREAQRNGGASTPPPPPAPPPYLGKCPARQQWDLDTRTCKDDP
jgi:hypothetical protein